VSPAAKAARCSILANPSVLNGVALRSDVKTKGDGGLLLALQAAQAPQLGPSNGWVLGALNETWSHVRLTSSDALRPCL
jgi:hypothetical protein